MSEDDSRVFDTQMVQKLRTIEERGINPYPYRFEKKDTISGICERFVEIGHDKSNETILTAGRVYIRRDHGKTIFADIGDDSGRIQVYIRKNDIGDEQFSFFSLFIERGDFVGVKGKVFRTRLGELTIWAEEITLLAKSIAMLPEKFHGLKDTEKRYRQRYIDLIVNEQVKASFRTRSRVISMIRRYLDENDFLEFETPVLQPVYGGANARPFTTHHHYLDQKFYLRIAPELYLKRIVVGGFERVYEIARNFRNEDIDSDHNPEFTMVELYWAYRDYNDMMDLTEDLITSIIEKTNNGSTTIPFGEIEISFSRPWTRITMEEAVKKYTGIDVLSHTMDELKQIATENGLTEYETLATSREFLVLIFEQMVEEKLIEPTFIYDFPIENSPLAKRHRTKKGFTERFELFINGFELANGFSELNDAIDQMERFQKQEERRRHGDAEAQMYDRDFVDALAYGMPPTGGVGIGIDRLLMIVTNNQSIKEVILFPQMKKESVIRHSE